MTPNTKSDLLYFKTLQYEEYNAEFDALYNK